MDDYDGEDEFQDALETQPIPTTMDMDTAMSEARTAVHLFFNNKFDDAWDMLRPWVGSSMYHTVGNAVFHFLEAVMTFDTNSIQIAGDALKMSIDLCNYHRKKHTLSNSIGKIVKKSNYKELTSEEIHAELCYAESLLLKSMLTFIEDETLVSFIKAGIKIRTCYSSYKECANILNYKQWINESHKVHFESGVRMGIGTFNLMISLLPARVIKLLEFIGFSGSKEMGLRELHAGFELHQGIRHILSVMTLLTYNLIVVYVLSSSDGDLEFCDQILRTQLQLYPEGAWFLYFKGRLEFMRGNINEANKWYTKSWKSQSVWPQFHHLCFWELIWTNCVKQDWEEASFYAGKLLSESRWSRTIYGYQRATILLMMESTPESRSEINHLMRHIPQWRQKFAGKSLPMEKFCAKKSERYLAQENKLVLPAIELLYVWNLFRVLSNNWKLCENVYNIVDREIIKFENAKGEEIKGGFEADNKALLLLLKGGCLYQMRSPLQAEECLKAVLVLEKKIKMDHYLIPFALVQLSIIHSSQGAKQKAIQILEDAKKNYTGYSLESRLHFHIHSALMGLNEEKKAAKAAGSPFF